MHEEDEELVEEGRGEEQHTEGRPGIIEMNVWDEAAISIQTGLQLVFLGTGGRASKHRSANLLISKPQRG